MTTIAITGAAGFIGFHAAKKLKDLGFTIVGFDNYNDFYDPSLKWDRTKELEKHEILVDQGDLMDPEFLNTWFSTYQPDIVLHLAAYANVRHSFKDPDKYLSNNVRGTQNLIEAVERHNVSKVVYASTSCVMHANKLPWNEDEICGHPNNPYGISKQANESQFLISNIPVAVGLRFFTVYGPWGRPDMALYDFTNNIIAGNEIELFNYGDMLRDFTYVDDIVQGISIVIANYMHHEEAREIYNIGLGEKVPLMEFVDHIENNLDRKAKRKLVEAKPGEALATWSDCTKLKKLGYQPETSIKEGVENFITWYKWYYEVN